MPVQQTAFERQYGSVPAATDAPAQGNGTQRPRKPDATFWLNIGYETEVDAEDGSTVMEFVPLPQGSALDTMDLAKISGQDDDYIARQSAKNALHAQIMELAKTMEPGQTEFLNLRVQIRRVKDKKTEVAPDANKFVRKLKLVG